MNISVFDNHLHTHKEGENITLKKFERASGNIINICNLHVRKLIIRLIISALHVFFLNRNSIQWSKYRYYR